MFELISVLADELSASTFVDIFGKILLPLLAATIALFAVHKSDERERGKRRREDVVRIAVEFVAAGGSAEDEIRAFIAGCANESRRAALIDEARPRVNPLLTAFEGLSVRLFFINCPARAQEAHDYSVELSECFANVVVLARTNPQQQGFKVFDERLEKLARLRASAVEELRLEVDRIDFSEQSGWLNRVLNFLFGRR
jgi:hypothetical protein